MGENKRLHRKRVLVAEVEFFIADDLAHDLTAQGAEIVGPVGAVEQVLRLLNGERRIDGAVLDIKLREAMLHPIANELLRRNVPFVFATGYDAATIPARFAGVPRCQKPIDGEKLAEAAALALDRPPPGADLRFTRVRQAGP